MLRKPTFEFIIRFLSIFTPKDKTKKMALIASISGIRGTIGGCERENLTPLDITRFAAAYGAWLSQHTTNRRIIIGRDARPSGEMLTALVSATLVGMGFDVIDLGLATTPTVEVAVPAEGAAGGIILTASHNPAEWNALKLLNSYGEFISESDGQKIITLYENPNYEFASVHELGKIWYKNNYLDYHLQRILALPLVDIQAIRNAQFRVVVDAVNSVGGIAVPRLLQLLGVAEIIPLHCVPNGKFPHNPEPLREHLSDICSAVTENSVDLGIVVDPDVDRLVLVCEDGELFGEEYTLVAVADYVLSHTPGYAVSNLSSSRALPLLAASKNSQYAAAAVGEVNVVKVMKQTNAVIGGEGNGGIIYPLLHYGRDALVGIALVLTHLAKQKVSLSELKKRYPALFMAKTKVTASKTASIDELFASLQKRYSDIPQNTEDGLKLDFPDFWVHIRRSNTEPILRIYTEAATQTQADEVAFAFMQQIQRMIA